MCCDIIQAQATATESQTEITIVLQGIHEEIHPYIVLVEARDNAMMILMCSMVAHTASISASIHTHY